MSVLSADFATRDEAATDTWLVLVLLACFAMWFGAVSRFVLPLPPIIAAFLPLALLLGTAVVSERLYALTFTRSLLYFAPLLVLAFASMLWSDDVLGVASKSLSLLALIVAVGAYVSAAQRPLDTLVRALVVYGAFHGFASLLLIYAGVGVTGDGSVVGLADHKSLLTNVSALGMLASWFALLHYPKSSTIGLLAIANLVLGGWILVIGGGGQAVLSLAVAVTVLHLALQSPRWAGVGLLAIAAFAILLPVSSDFMVLLADLTGKDVTLSGRLYLWAFGRSGIMEAPLLGHGFSNVGNSEAWRVWQLDVFEKIFGLSDFVVPNMHNQWIELAYMLGLPGLFVGVWLLVWQPARAAMIGGGDAAIGTAFLAMALMISAFGTSILITTGESFITMGAIVALLANKQEQVA